MQQEVYGEVIQGEIVGVEPVIPTAQPVVGVQPSYAAEPVGAYKGYGEVAPPPPPPRIIDSRLVLVRRGSPNVLRFDHWQALQAGGAAPLTCHASHPGNGIGKMYPEERRFQEWRYTESKCVAARDACSVQLVQGKFLKRVDANLVLDVAFWKFHEGTAVNWVGGGSDSRTYLHGGGRDFRVNSDGSICLVDHPHLSLGVDESLGVDVQERLAPHLTELQEKWDEESRRRARVAKMLPCLCCCDDGQYIYCCLPTAPTYILPLCLHMVLCPQQRCNPQIIDGLCGQPGIRKLHAGEIRGGGGGTPIGPASTAFEEACKVHCVANVPLFWVCPCGPCGWCCLQSDNGVTKFGHGWGSPDCIWNPILCWDFKPPCGQSAYQCSVDFPPCCILCVICNNPDIGMQLKSFDPDIIENPGSGCWVPKG